MSEPNIFVCAPTYCEPNQVLKFLNSFNYVSYPRLELLIVNANPGDKTSEIISNYQRRFRFSISEITAESSDFWSASVNRGLRRILEKAGSDDWILLMNVDVRFDYDLVSLLIQRAVQRGQCQIGALATSSNFVISSGVKVKSWVATINQHPFSGHRVTDIPNDILVPVDYLPTRCLMFPVAGLRKVDLIAEKWLPHYSADYEFSYRLMKNGFQPYISTAIRVESDTDNTGESSYVKKVSFFSRLSKITSIKNPSNPWYRSVFVCLVYPAYAVPTALLLYLIRTLLETFLGGGNIRKVFKTKEHGFSK